MSAGAHLDAAITAERAAYEAELRGAADPALYVKARDDYLASHAETGPRSWGRLIGALKMAVLAGDGADRIARQALAESAGVEGPSAGYARALAAVIVGEAPDTVAMEQAGGAFERTGRALRALAAGDAEAYHRALDEIQADFAAREQHLTGVAVADTAMVLERLAARRVWHPQGA